MATEPREKITQRSVGIHQRQFEFLQDNPDFQLDDFVRTELDKKIAELKKFKFLEYKKWD